MLTPLELLESVTHENWQNMNVFAPHLEKKCWGQVMHCFYDHRVGVSYLRVNKGFRCSNHYHKYRDNIFVVISGAIAVVSFEPVFSNGKNSGEEIVKANRHVQTATPCGSICVPAGVIHRFEVIESGEINEIYLPGKLRGGKVDIDDIVRLDEGGPV